MRSRSKMRRWKMAVLGVNALLLVLAGCQTQRGEPGAPPEGQAASANGVDPVQPAGGELTFALATSPDSLDPHRSGLAVAVRVIRTIHDSLVVQDDNGQIKPWLAESWDISDDGLTYTFKLREDVKFHDGTPFNAEAVKYNIERLLDPATKAETRLRCCARTILRGGGRAHDPRASVRAVQRFPRQLRPGAARHRLADRRGEVRRGSGAPSRRHRAFQIRELVQERVHYRGTE